MLSRPQNFRLNPRSPLARGLVFAGLGQGCAGTPRFYDSCAGVIHAGNHGLLTNMDPATDCVFSPELGRWGLRFAKASDQSVNTTANLPALLLGQSAAQGCWIKTTQSDDFIGVLTRYDGAKGLLLEISGGKLRVWCNAKVFYSAASVNDDVWHHVLVQRIGQTATCYIDGKPDGTVTDPVVDDAIPACVARLGWWGGTSSDFDGKLSDACFYDRALALPGISALADPSNVMLSVGGVPLIEPVGPRWTPEAAAGETYNLTANDSTHAHAAETPAITQVHALAAAHATHGQPADEPALTQVHVLAADHCTHAHAAESPAITQVHSLAADDATHAHDCDSSAITQFHALMGDDCAHAHAVDSPALTQLHKMVAAACTHSHSADSPTLGLPLRLPCRIVAVDVFCAGVESGVVFTPGVTAGDVFRAGVDAGQVLGA